MQSKGDDRTVVVLLLSLPSPVEAGESAVGGQVAIIDEVEKPLDLVGGLAPLSPIECHVIILHD